MNDSLAYAPPSAGTLDLPRWKTVAATICAVLLGLLFIVSGVWKITDPLGAATRMMQAKVPGEVALPFAILLGIGEAFSGVLLLVPRFRRWGAWLTTLMLVAFMIYIGYYYDALRGEECSCFPWLKRAVGPGFFIGDAIMLVFAGIAGWWSVRSHGLRPAALILSAVAVFAAVSYGVAARQQSGAPAPASITVEGKATSLGMGRHFVYFYDPMCTHCAEAAKRLSQHQWPTDVKLIAIPTGTNEFARGFLNDTKLPAGLSLDIEPMKKAFPFGDPPYAVLLENGRAKATLSRFDEKEPESQLRQLGYIK